MKYLINFLFISVSFISIGQNTYFDLKKDTVKLDTAKTNIIVCFSTNSCHDCYITLEKFFYYSDAYTNKDLNISTLSFIDSSSLNNISMRKVFYNNSKYYFPAVKQRLFTAKKEEKCILFNTELDERLFPVVCVWKGESRNFFTYEDFITYYSLNNY